MRKKEEYANWKSWPALFFFVGEGGEPPPFYRIINNFLLFYHGQLIRTYIKNTIVESSSKRRLVYLRT